MKTEKIGQSPAFAAANNGGLQKGISQRLYLAGIAMQGLLAKWNTAIPSDTIVSRDPETDRKISGNEACQKTLEVMVKMSLMAADELLRQYNIE